MAMTDTEKKLRDALVEIQEAIGREERGYQPAPPPAVLQGVLDELRAIINRALDEPKCPACRRPVKLVSYVKNVTGGPRHKVACSAGWGGDAMIGDFPACGMEWPYRTTEAEAWAAFRELQPGGGA